MFLNNDLNLFQGKFATKLLHRQENVFLGDLAREVGVKLVEDSLETSICSYATRVYRCSQELMVVDHAIAMEVQLRDDFFDLLLADVTLLLQEYCLQLLDLNHTIAVFVNSFESCTKLLDLSFACCLNEQVHGSLLEGRHAFEAAKSRQQIIANLAVATIDFCSSHYIFLKFEPGMVKRLLCTQAIALTDNKELTNKIFTLITDHFKLFVIEVKLGALDLFEDIRGFFTLKR